VLRDLAIGYAVKTPLLPPAREHSQLTSSLLGLHRRILLQACVEQLSTNCLMGIKAAKLL
jgi:hypothetical protein